MTEIMQSRQQAPQVISPFVREQRQIIHESGILIRPLSEGICNITRIQTADNDVYLGRAIREGGRSQTPHGIDYSDLWVISPHGGHPYTFDIPPVPGIVNNEDPRSLVVGDNIFVGFTAVSPEQSDGTIPYSPAIIQARFGNSGKLEAIPESLRVFTHLNGESLQGRNVTPYSYNEGVLRFFMRIDDGEHNHTFSFFETDRESLIRTADLPIPKVSWNTRKSGTTGTPIRMENGNYLFLIHGQAEEEDVVHYRLGFLEFNPDTKAMRISQEAVLTRDMFPFGKELRPTEKSVVYGTDNLRLTQFPDGTPAVASAVSVGDDAAGEVIIPFSTIEKSFEEVETKAA